MLSIHTDPWNSVPAGEGGDVFSNNGEIESCRSIVRTNIFVDAQDLRPQLLRNANRKKKASAESILDCLISLY